MLPALNLPLQNDVDETYEVEEVVGTWLVMPWAPTPQAPSRGGDFDPRERGFTMVDGGRQTQKQKHIAEILKTGGLTMTTLHASSYIYQLVVDIKGMSPISSIALVKSFVADSWIITSNALAPMVGDLEVGEAFARALVMLLVKRALTIEQLGPVSEVLKLLNFVKLASEAMNGFNYNPELAETLAQISAIPLLLYTSLARIVVDMSVQTWLTQFGNLKAFLIEASQFQLVIHLAGNFGPYGNKLRSSWAKTIKNAPPELRAFVLRHAVHETDKMHSILSEFAENFGPLRGRRSK